MHHPPRRTLRLQPLLPAALLLAVFGCRPTADTDDEETDPPVEQPRDLQFGDDPMGLALATLNDASLTPIRPVFDAGIARWIDLEVPLPPGEDAVAQVLTLLEAHGEVWGVQRPAEQLYLTAASEHEGWTHLTFGQRLAGLPVFGASLGMHLRDGHLRYAVGTHVIEQPPTGFVQIPADEAASLVEDASEGRWSPVGPTQPMWWDPGLPWGRRDGLRPVWTARATDGTTSARVIVDAETGELLATIGEDHTFDLDLETVGGSTTQDCWSDTTDDDDWYDEDGPDGWPSGGDPYNDGPTGAAALADTYNWYRARFGRVGWDNDDAEVVAYVRVGDAETGSPNWPNAKWSGGCKQLWFGDSMPKLDIVGHEYTHAVIGHTSKLIYYAFSGALNESIADLMPSLMSDDWVMGDTAETFTGDRNILDPGAQGLPDTFLELVLTNADNGGVHTNSSLTNHAVGIMARPTVTATLRPIPGMSAEAVSCLLYVVTAHVLQPSSTYADLRLSLLGAVRNQECGVPNTAANQCTVLNAFYDVGVGLGDLDCDGLDDGTEDNDDDGDFWNDTIDNCPGVPNTVQLDTDKDGDGDVCDPNDDNDGYLDEIDLCPLLAHPNNDDTNSNGIGDVCDDRDTDGIMDAFDNCVDRFNPKQTDVDGDGLGAPCDDDDDNDSVLDPADNCTDVFNPAQAEQDGDGWGDACDNCPALTNADQVDCDGDGIGLACAAPGSPELQAEQACAEARRAETIGGIISSLILSQPGLKTPMPGCLTCGRWADPASRVEILLSNQAPGDRWALIDQHGSLVSRAKANDDGTLTLRYAPDPASHWAPDALESPLSEVQLFLTNLSTDAAGRVEVEVRAAR